MGVGGPVRAWSADYERKVSVQGGGRSRLEAGIWVCCKEGAFLLPVDRAAKARPGFAESEAHARSWATGDGLLARLASELIAECRKQGTQAHLLFNNIISNGWARLPAESVAKYELKRDAVLYDKRGANTAFLVDALEEAGFESMAKKLGEQRKKVIEQRRAPPRRRRAATGVVVDGWRRQADEAEVRSYRSLSAASKPQPEPAAKRKRPADPSPRPSGRAPSPAGGGFRSLAAGSSAGPSAGGPGASAAASGGGGGKPAKAARRLEPSDHDVARAMLKVLKKGARALVVGAGGDGGEGPAPDDAVEPRALAPGGQARPEGAPRLVRLLHGDDMLGVGATPGVEPEREVTVIHDDDSDDGGGVEKGGPGGRRRGARRPRGGAFGNIDDL